MENQPNHTTVFLCRDDPDGIFTAVYDAWASRRGHACVRLQLEGPSTLELFCDYIPVTPDPQKADKVIGAIRQNISLQAWEAVYRAALSREERKADIIYRFLVAGFHYGPAVMEMLGEPAVQNLFALDRQVGNEAHFFTEFLRFDLMEQDILFAKMRPKSNVLSLVAPHFADRLSGENFLILDVGRSFAAIHPAGRSWYLLSIEKEQAEALLSQKPNSYRDLWKTFHSAIAVEARKNPKLQRSLMPLRYREFVTEFL